MVQLKKLDKKIVDQVDMKQPGMSRPALAYGVVAVYVIFMMLMPWVDLQGFEFVDRERYINYFLYEDNILDYREFNGLVDYIKNEALWHYLIPLLKDGLSLGLNQIFFVISVFCLTVFGLFMVRYQPPWAVFLMASPLMVTLAFSQLRMALAYSLILLAYMVRRKFLVVLLVLPALFIHTSIAMFVALYIGMRIMERLYQKYWPNKIFITMACVFFGASISVAIGPLRDVILGAIGDRRADYGDASSSILYTLFWLGLLVATLFQRGSYYKSEVNRYAIIILSLVSLNLLTGGYTLRFLSIGMPMIMSAMLDMDKDKAGQVLVIYLAYLTFQWIYWAKVGFF